MPRVARTVAKGYPHHITQRGNYRQVVFDADADYLQYLKYGLNNRIIGTAPILY